MSTRSGDVPTPPGRDDASDDGTWQQRERYRELLEELRTIIPGVQVLFAFLLTVPFSSRFADLDTVGRRVFIFSLASAALAAVVVLSPAAYHRLNDQRARDRRLTLGVRAQLAGMVLLAISITLAVFVVARFIFTTTVGGVVAAVVAAAAVVLWWVLPLIDRPHGEGSPF